VLEQVTAIQDRHIDRFFSLVGDKHHIAYAQGLGESYARVLSLVSRQMSDAPEAVHAACDLVLRRKTIWVEALAQSRGVQQVSGQHLVRPDGTVSLGLYGSVRVAGLTLPEIKAAVEAYLSQYLEKPEIAVDVLAYNSKVYYLIYDTAGTGEQVVRLPVTGNETVLDAVANLNGLSPVANRCGIYVVRPAPACHGCDQVLPVEWEAVVRRGRTDTNYQLLPGDRVYVEADPFVTFDTRLSRFLAPFERMFGFTLLGNGTIRAVSGHSGNGNGNGG